VDSFWPTKRSQEQVYTSLQQMIFPRQHPIDSARMDRRRTVAQVVGAELEPEVEACLR